MRNGKARMPNSAMACTSSPVVTAPLATREAPNQSRTIVPRFGRASRPGFEARAQTSHDEPLAPQILGTSRQALDLPLLESERLDDQGALEALVGDGGHVAHPRLGRGRRLFDLLRVGVVEQGEAGEERQRHGEEHGVDEGELGHRHHDDHDDAERERQWLHDHGRAFAVGIGVGEQLAGGVLVEPAERHGEVPIGHALEPLDLHPPLRHLPEEAAEHDPDHAKQRRTDDGGGAERDGAPLNPSLLEGRREDVVGDAPEHDRAAHGHDGEEDGAGDREREGTGLRPHGQPQQAHAAPHDPVVPIPPCHGGRTYRRA